MSCSIRLALFATFAALTAAAAAQPSTDVSPFFDHMLKKWDANADGRISLDEYLNAATARFQQFDTANKGSITAAQIANSPAAGKRLQRRAQRLVKHLDTAGKGYVTQDDYVAGAKTRFAKLDTHGDGRLTMDELSPRHAGRIAQHAPKRFEELDTNHDGVVTQNEFVAKAIADFRALDVHGTGKLTAADIAASPKAHERAARVAERIAKRLDGNGDGVVTREEFLAAAKQRFARIDKNGDGFIDANEIAARRSAHGGKPGDSNRQ